MEQSRERPEGAVLIDTENVFKAFLKDAPRHFDRSSRYGEAAVNLHRRDLPLEAVWREGPRYFEALVAWLDRRFALVARRSYGKHRDPGVAALYATMMEATTWTHTDVPWGADMADNAIVQDLDLFAFNPRCQALVVASSDTRTVLAKLDAIAAQGWHRCVAILGPDSPGPWRFRAGGGLEHLQERYSLATIFAEESRLRMKSAGGEGPPATELATIARNARKRQNHRTAAQKRAAYAKLADDLYAAASDTARDEIRRRLGTANTLAGIASIQAGMTGAVTSLTGSERKRELLDWIGEGADEARRGMGEAPE